MRDVHLVHVLHSLEQPFMNFLRVTGVGRISYLEHLLEEGDYLTDCLPYRVVAWAQKRHDYDGLLAEV